MNEHRNILNPQALLNLYGDFSPLNYSEVLEILLKRDEPRVSIKLMTEKKPKNPPAKWTQSYDVVYLGISFIGIKKLVAAGWGHKNIVDQFNIQNSNNSASVQISCSESFSMTFDCDWISIDSLVPGSIGRP